MDETFGKQALLGLLTELGRRLTVDVEATVVGGSAGLLTGQLPSTRVTIDCDVIRTEPPEESMSLLSAARDLAKAHGLSAEWLSQRVAELDVLPSGWRRRRILIGTFGRLTVRCVGRSDLLAMKVYAGRMQDREDILSMSPTREELRFVREYLQQLRVPSRNADRDQIQSALRFVASLEDES